MITVLLPGNFSGDVMHLPPCGPCLIRGSSAGLRIPPGPDIDSGGCCTPGGCWLEAAGLLLPGESGLARLHNPARIDYTCSHGVVWLHV